MISLLPLFASVQMGLLLVDSVLVFEQEIAEETEKNCNLQSPRSQIGVC